MLSSVTADRPPRPPSHTSSSDSKVCRNEDLSESVVSKESKPQPAARSLSKTPIPETHKQTDQEVSNQVAPQPRPRQRLASFGGVSSPSSASPFTGLGAYNQASNRSTAAGNETHAKLSSSLGSRGSTGCLRMSPESSGRTTPVPNLGPTHLQHVRDQMVAALQKLKELEEQVKIIPILQVRISVLQEEKRQLASQLKTQSDAEGFNRGLKDVERNDGAEYRQLTEEMRALEATGTRLQGCNPQSLQSEKDKEIHVSSCQPSKVNKSVLTDQVEARSVSTDVSEIHLGIYTERDAEIDAQQLIIGALKDRISHLEAELKESALQAEMNLLKLELKAAGARNRADKSTFARPSTKGASTEARPPTTNQGVGSPTELWDASSAVKIELKTVGICCRPELKDVCTGPDVLMSRWEVRERVEVVEKSVGNHIVMITQGVGMETKPCDAETNTEIPLQDLIPKKEKQYNSIACGDCSVHVNVCEEKTSPRAGSQCTNTASASVSSSTNTVQAFIKDSSTNTVLNTRNKHSNTTQAVTRTVSVGNLAKDMRCTPQSCGGCASASKQFQTQVSKVTRDTGVGFININDNFLVGLKIRHMASGPSHLPDPIRMRSIGVGEGRVQDLTVSSGHPVDKMKPQWEPELNHYIEKMHKLLKEQGDFIQEEQSHDRDGFLLQQQENGSNQLSKDNSSTLIHPLDIQPAEFITSTTNSFYFLVRTGHSPPQSSPDSSKCDLNPETFITRGSEVKRMIQVLEEQTSSVLRGEYVTCACKKTKSSMLQSGTKNLNGDQGCSSTRRNLKLLRVTTGLNPSYKPYAVEKANAEEGEKRGNKKIKETSRDAAPTRKVKAASAKASKVCTRSQTQPNLNLNHSIIILFRCKLSEKMFLACQALKMHLGDSTALSSKELYDCLQTVQQEWFSVSSQKSAFPATVETYLSIFRSISPSVLQHIANMPDANGNTALHYSVSHSNFGIVQKMLEADVCDVNHQNKAGYTPIMLAALAAVESPEDMRVVEQLFSKGDVNAKASQAGQTALMLAVSHGRMGMVRALLDRGADVNLQDDEGSTALMCASEHGHADIVRLLLAQADCDATLMDSDESTALSIALEAGHNDIAVLLYAHANFSRGHAVAAGTRMHY
ncbi:hypothetical protein fugu_019254 [Takifugu bimaculatus]|uniref:Uncharacterized protein n=1 Tax=Takifugu bimaculatus TaxID=433685 RepID=A0A4Z2BJY8_9TELE|nr:hypothetical protein fugu_019254 [Takifugu bimaculatus]